MQIDLQVIEREARQAWSQSPALRAEFADSEASYLAYRRADARGAARIFSGRVVRGAPGATQRFTLDAPISLAGTASFKLSTSARGRVKGYAAVFGTTNRKRSRIMPGAFRKALARVPLVMLWQHNADKPVGRWDVLREDSFGLLAEGQINLDVPAGRDAFELLKNQDVTGLSVGIDAQPDGYEEVDGVLVFNEVDLLEISLASVPAEDAARMLEVTRGA